MTRACHGWWSSRKACLLRQYWHVSESIASKLALEEQMQSSGMPAEALIKGSAQKWIGFAEAEEQTTNPGPNHDDEPVNRDDEQKELVKACYSWYSSCVHRLIAAGSRGENETVTFDRSIVFRWESRI